MKKILLLILVILFSHHASAEVGSGNSRFGLSGGLFHTNNPNQTSFSLNAEYEYRMGAFYGVGAQAAHIFSTPSFTLIAAPALYLHPLAGSWYISASPVFYIGSGDTLVGARFMTRMPLDIDFLSLTPIFGVDVIKGGPNYILGLGVSI